MGGRKCLDLILSLSKGTATHLISAEPPEPNAHAAAAIASTAERAGSFVCIFVFLTCLMLDTIKRLYLVSTKDIPQLLS